GYTQYEAWIEATSWDFYTELLRNYDLTGATEWSYFWARRASPEPPPELVWAATILPGYDGVQLPTVPTFAGSSPYVLYQVEIDYEVHNPLHVLPIIGAAPRYLIRAVKAIQRDAVTLNPYVTRERFPLIAKSGTAPVLQWAVYGLFPDASIDVKAIRLSLVHTSAQNGQWLMDLIAQQRDSTPQFR
ncbi:MAG TPA: hypothetical protein VHV78_00185, partial [Gemmatimonadaceae bacterium]|nr:hypothetical protein [Gemmatimonadaceae bacterium]